MRTRLAAVLAALVLTTTGYAGQPQPPAPDDTPQIAFEVRVLTLPDAFFFERVGIDFNTNSGAPANIRSKPLEDGLLTDAQLATLLEAVQGDRRSNIVQAPKVTTENGKEAVVSMVQQQMFLTGLDAVRVKGEVVVVPRNTPTETGTRFALTGRVSADGKSVETAIRYTDTQVAPNAPMIPVTTLINPVMKDGKAGKPVPFTQFLQVPQVETVTIEKEKLAIPAGGHAVLVGPAQTREVRTEYGPPVLSKVPYMNRLFKNVGIGRETTRTVLVVTPRVLEAE